MLAIFSKKFDTKSIFLCNKSLMIHQNRLFKMDKNYFYNLTFFYKKNLKMDTNPKVFFHDGNQMPLIGMGMLNFKANDKTFNLNDFIMKAANLGYSHFDVTNN